MGSGINFRDFLIEKIDNASNEADMVLQQLLHNVDESHVEYTDERLDFNVGIMVNRSAYSRLYVTILNSETNSVRLARNTQKDGFSIVIETTNYPSRNDIDKMLSNPKLYSGVKNELISFLNTYQGDETNFKTTYESDKEINTPKEFEELYTAISDGINERVKEYKEKVYKMKYEMDNTADEEHKQHLLRGMDTLKADSFGDSFKKFKKIASEEFDVDLTRFNKEYKAKFDSRLEDKYEYIINKLG